MVKIFIDGQPVDALEGTTIFNAAKEAGIAIPHFCYHPAFEPEGTCRMCLVEIEGMPKLELSCSTQVREGMKVFTKNERVVEARKGVLEFLLAALATPKSMSFTRPSKEIKMFCGLTSRWTKPSSRPAWSRLLWA